MAAGGVYKILVTGTSTVETRKTDVVKAVTTRG